MRTYLSAVRNAFEDQNQLHISLDESVVGGEGTMIAAVVCHNTGKAGWLLPQAIVLGWPLGRFPGTSSTGLRDRITGLRHQMFERGKIQMAPFGPIWAHFRVQKFPKWRFGFLPTHIWYGRGAALSEVGPKEVPLDGQGSSVFPCGLCDWPLWAGAAFGNGVVIAWRPAPIASS